MAVEALWDTVIGKRLSGAPGPSHATATVDIDLAVGVTLKCDLLERAAGGNERCITFGKVSFHVCRQVALVRVRGDVAG